MGSIAGAEDRDRESGPMVDPIQRHSEQVEAGLEAAVEVGDCPIVEQQARGLMQAGMLAGGCLAAPVQRHWEQPQMIGHFVEAGDEP